jgi:hypothetical protein
VHHQYCGQFGKQANCQVAVTLSIADHHASLPIAYRLYLPRDWGKDAARRKKAHVPAAIKFKTKPQIASSRSMRPARRACRGAPDPAPTPRPQLPECCCGAPVARAAPLATQHTVRFKS